MVKYVIAVALTIIITTAVAHDVQNETVKARMDSMKEIAANMRALGSMVKGIEPFDSEKVKTITTKIAKLASQTPGLFAAEASDPKSEAKPEIWRNFSDFTSKAKTLENKSLQLAENPPMDLKGLKTGMRSLGSACGSCHRSYRQ